MAIALIGGLITSTILTLVALPALYELAEGLHAKVSQAWLRVRGSGAESTTPASAGD
jgi:hypothetical protein